MNNILIIGDSFAADWTIKYPNAVGWPNLLAKEYNVVNLAQAGVGEYKIYQQLCSVDDIGKFDLILISHTSPYRINTKRHPVHHSDPLHKNADLIFSDIEYHKKSIFTWFNKSLITAFNFFIYHSDDEYLETVYALLRKQIYEMVGATNSIVLTNFNVPEKFIIEKHFLNFKNTQLTCPGVANHMSDIGNKIVYDTLAAKIKELGLKDFKNNKKEITTIKGDTK